MTCVRLDFAYPESVATDFLEDFDVKYFIFHREGRPNFEVFIMGYDSEILKMLEAYAEGDKDEEKFLALTRNVMKRSSPEPTPQELSLWQAFKQFDTYKGIADHLGWTTQRVKDLCARRWWTYFIQDAAKFKPDYHLLNMYQAYLRCTSYKEAADLVQQDCQKVAGYFKIRGWTYDCGRRVY